MCRGFVGIAPCVKTAGRRGYNRTAYRETRDERRANRPRYLKYG